MQNTVADYAKGFRKSKHQKSEPLKISLMGHDDGKLHWLYR